MDEFDGDVIPFVEEPEDRRPRDRARRNPKPTPPPHPPAYSFKGAFSTGWRSINAHYGMLLGVIVAYAGILIGVMMLVGILDGVVVAILEPLGTVAYWVTPFEWGALFLVKVPLVAGLFWFGARAARKETPEFNDMFEGFRSYWGVVLAGGAPALVEYLATMPGTVLMALEFGTTLDLTSPRFIAGVVVFLAGWLGGLYLRVRLLGAQIMLIDDRAPELTVTEALRASWAMTEGKTLSLMGLGLTLGAITLVSAVLLCLPLLFIGAPVAITVAAAAYSMLAHQRGVAPVGDYSGCPACGYDTSTIETNICPECGNILPGSGAMRPIMY